MSTPLDYFDEFETAGVKVVVARYFYFDSEAYLYAARLRESGIKCFVSNSNTIAAVPLGNGGIGLHVRQNDLPEALRLLKEVDGQEPLEQDFREADLEDIEYERAINEGRSSVNIGLVIFVLVVVGLLIWRAFSRAAGLVGTFQKDVSLRLLQLSAQLRTETGSNPPWSNNNSFAPYERCFSRIIYYPVVLIKL